MADIPFQSIARSALQTYVRRFPVSKGKQRLVDLLWKSLSTGSTALPTTLSQAEVQIVCDLTQYIQRHIYYWGSYEREACAIWMQRARSSRTIFDVGANIGIYSLLAATANPQAHVHAFEPTPEIIYAFRQNIQLNNLTNITVNATGIGKEDGCAVLRQCRGLDETNEGMNFIVEIAQEKFASDLRVPVVSLDNYCERQGIDQIDLLKMDIEGGEYDALNGATRLLRTQAIKCIFFELVEWSAARSGHSTTDIKRLLGESGYKLYEVSGGGLKPVRGESAESIACAVALPKD
jgi:FkbM family methyltransferase